MGCGGGGSSSTPAVQAPSSIAYATNPGVFTRGVAVSDLASYSGGTPTSYTVTPALPAGLALDASSGAITGTPTAVTAKVTYTVTGSNSAGGSAVFLPITVNDPAPTGLTYTLTTAAYPRGVAITANAPTSGGGAVASYAISPSLPAGLSFSTSTGVISGTPTVATAAAAYVVTATNTGGSAQATLTLSVVEYAPTNLTYSLNPAVYARGAAITANTPSYGGSTATLFTVSPALPAGLSLNASTGAISGTPTTVTAAAAYVVTASNTGGSGQATLTLSVTEQAPTGLTYSLNPAVYVRGTAIASNSPSSTGGGATGYAVSPALPAGLALNASTGVITGTPTAVAAAAPYVVTASNAAGSTQATLTITVNEAPPKTLTYTLATAYYSVGAAITANSPTVTGGTPTAYAVSPALPAGITLNTATGVISGTPTATASQASYTVTASNAGGSATAVLTITVFPAGSTLDLTIANVEFLQSPQTLTNTVPIVAGKNGLVRVFVVANQSNTVRPDVQVTLTNNGTAVPGYPKTVAAPSTSVPLAVSEGTLSSSWNLAIPGTDLAAPTGTGYAITAVVDPLALISEGDHSNNTAQVALTGVSVPTFRTTIFPVVLASGTGNITEANKAAWVARLAKMWPVADVDIVVGTAFTGSVTTLGSDGTGWSTLLSDLMVKHQTDAASARYYYGALNVSYDSGTAGLGYVAGNTAPYYYRTALGWDKSSGYRDGGLYPEVFAHEVGHNFGLSHAPCGSVSSSDASYPYTGGLIGTWAYDSVLGVLETPTATFDIMGYCSPNWVSDYNYKKVLTSRTASGGSLIVSADAAAQSECLLVRGIVHADGTTELLPGFRTRTTPTTAKLEGDMRVEGLNASGTLLFTSTLELVEAGCEPASHDRHFLLALPLASADLNALSSLRVLKDGQILTSRTATASLAAAAEPSVRRLASGQMAISWDAATHPAVMVRDAATGEVVAILTGGERTFQATASSLDLVFSDGVKGHTLRVKQTE